MANSKDRRTLRRKLPEAGLLQSPLQKTLEPPAKKNRFRLFVGRFFKLTWNVVVVVATLIALITVLEVFPWLSIAEGTNLRPNDPFSELFSISNDGYIPVTDLDVVCIDSFSDFTGIKVNGGQTHIKEFARKLNHSGRATLPCFKSIVLKGVSLREAQIEAIVTYSIWPFTYRRFRMSKKFHFTGINAEDGRMVWKFDS